MESLCYKQCRLWNDNVSNHCDSRNSKTRYKFCHFGFQSLGDLVLLNVQLIPLQVEAIFHGSMRHGSRKYTQIVFLF